MTDDSALAVLVGGYFHQDVFDVYEDEFAAADDFARSDPGLAAQLLADIPDLLDESPDEECLKTQLEGLGLAFRPDEGTTYREWLTRIADRVRAATA